MNQIDAFKTNGSSPPKRFRGCYPGQVAVPVADTPAVDFLVSNYGTIFLLQPQTDAAVAWADAHLPADRQLWGASTVVEHRFINAIYLGIVADGLRVR